MILFVSQFLSMPFALTNEHVGSIANDVTPWIGSIARQDSGLWADYALLLLLGGVPWQCYFQRVNIKAFESVNTNAIPPSQH